MKFKNECPCGSQKSYKECCGVFHAGVLPSSPEQLMRSRYTAYFLGDADYIMSTTHPGNPLFEVDREKWKKKILEFSSLTEFRSLEVLDSEQRGDFGTVTFIAYLFQGDQEVSFKEKSEFRRENGKWFYFGGEFRSRP